MTHLLTSTAAALALATAAQAEGYNFGMQEMTITDPSGAREISGVVWYPTLESETTKALGNKVWRSLRVAPDAEPNPGSYPLVVLSHGMYGNYRNQAWLAEGLVERGYVVAAIDHPGTSTFSKDPAQAQDLHERPKDISRTIDAIENAPWINAHLSGDVFMAGHSLGGWTTVALAGGRFDAEKYHSFCASSEADIACNVLAGWNVATTEDGRAALEQDLSDPRISAFAVFDLGGTQTFTAESLSAIERPMMVYGARDGFEDERLNLDIESRALAAALPEHSTIYHEPEGLQHFDFLGQCTWLGLSILRIVEPQDAFVCADGRKPRVQKHNQIIEQLDAFFASNHNANS